MEPKRVQPVRVLFIDHVPRLSGAEQSLADLVTGLSAGPVEPVVVLPEDGPLAQRLRAHGVLVRMVPMSRRMLQTSREQLARHPLAAIAQLVSFLTAGWRIFRLIREVRPRIVHTNTLKSHLIAVLPCRIARVPLVWHLRDILPHGWLERAVVACARFADAIIVPSRAVGEPFRGRRTLLRKLRLVPNGIRVSDFQDARTDRSLREMMGVERSDVVVGLVARIAPWKGQDQFLRAAAMLSRRYPKVHFAIIGAPLFVQDEAYEQALHRMAYDLGIDDRITFCGWQPAPEAFAALDVVVHASQEPEPFGRAIVEAMAAGKPVVATDGGAVREILPPACGFIVPAGRPELLADALDRIVGDRKIRKRMGEAAAAIADSYFPVQRTIQSVAQVYRALVAKAPQRKSSRVSQRPNRARRNRRRSRPQQPQQTPMSWPRAEQRFDAPERRFDAPDQRPARTAPAAPPARPRDEDRITVRLDDDFDADARSPLDEPRRPYGEPHPTRSSRRGRPEKRRADAERPVQHSEPAVAPMPEPVAPMPEPPVLPDGPSARTATDGPAARTATVERARPIALTRTKRRVRVELPTEQQRSSRPVAIAEPLLDERGSVLTAPASAPVSAPESAPVVAPAPAPVVAPDRTLPIVVDPKPVYDALKRMIDLVLAAAILILGSPAWILVAIAIKLESTGPVLHRGTVYGRGCKPFTYYKFRSMRIDGDDAAHRRFIERYVRENGGHEHEGEVIYKLMADERVTAVGRFIRTLSIDEVPQLLNVLLGQMSIVGPRPPLDYEFEHYDERARRRLCVLPGITGMQQIWHRHSASFEDKLKLDEKYVQNRSLWLDLKLILHTPRAALRGH